MPFKTDQENFWAGDFGREYLRRNTGPELLASNLALFARALKTARRLRDCLEVGANIGMNLQALKLLYPDQDQYAVEINAEAVTELAKVIPSRNITHASLLDFHPVRTFDLVLTKGVLIHINPESLGRAYDLLHQATRRYLLVCEYYNPSPVSITYRGHSDRLFKRDFCGELLERYQDLKLADYGFTYRGDPDFPQDDITWFLMEKRSRDA